MTVLYFASLRDAAGVGVGTACETAAPDLRGLYEELQSRHAVAVAGAISCASRSTASSRSGTDTLRDGAEIAFIPPVSGG